MQHPPPRPRRIVGGVQAVLDPRLESHGAPSMHIDSGRIDTGFSAAPARRVRTTSAENPFASFYESRRKISLDADDEDEIADPSSSITRAYIVPDALLALARGERDGSAGGSSAGDKPLDAGPAGNRSSSHARFVATDRADVATESASMFRFRSPPAVGFAAEWRSLQRIAWQMAGWLRRAWRRSIPD